MAHFNNKLFKHGFVTEDDYESALLNPQIALEFLRKISNEKINEFEPLFLNSSLASVEDTYSFVYKYADLLNIDKYEEYFKGTEYELLYLHKIKKIDLSKLEHLLFKSYNDINNIDMLTDYINKYSNGSDYIFKKGQEIAFQKPDYAAQFAFYVKFADLNLCKKHAKGSSFYNKILKFNDLLLCKYFKGILTLEDQKEALTRSEWSYWFARANVPGSDFAALQAKACEDPWYAYLFAKYVPGADIQYCQEHACKDPDNAYTFAKNIPGADIKYCQEHACKNPKNASLFAKDIPGSDIDLLQDYFYIDYASALNVINIPNVNVNKLIEAIINYDYEKNISLKDNPKQIKKYAYYRAALKAPNGSISEENQMKLVDNLVCLTKNITYSKAIERWHRLNNMQKACA